MKINPVTITLLPVAVLAVGLCGSLAVGLVVGGVVLLLTRPFARSY